MKSSFRSCGLLTPAPSTGHAAMHPLTKVNGGLHHGIVGCRMSAFTGLKEGNERCLNKASLNESDMNKHLAPFTCGLS